MIGQKFNQWTVIGPKRSDGRRQYWLCQCDCGTVKEVRQDNLKSGLSTGCGCARSYKQSQRLTKDLSNQKFGQLTVLYQSPDSSLYSDNYAHWICQCSCGKLTDVASHNLVSGRTQSCGCGIGQHSIGEENIATILKENNISFVRQYSFPAIKQYKYDFYLPEFNRLIEFDGKQHYEPIPFFGGQEEFEKQQRNDCIKNEYAFQQGIDLVRIPYTERDNISLEILIGNKYLICGKLSDQF